MNSISSNPQLPPHQPPLNALQAASHKIVVKTLSNPPVSPPQSQIHLLQDVVEIALKGENGVEGSPGHEGLDGSYGGSGGQGGQGGSGTNGMNGANINVSLEIHDNHILAVSDNKQYRLPYGNPNSSIQVKSTGGKGGDGGYGGQGGEASSYNSSYLQGNDTVYTYKQGTVGSGGHGGNGGDGGNGGVITVSVQPDETDLLSLVEWDVSGGSEGLGGNAGFGGHGFIGTKPKTVWGILKENEMVWGEGPRGSCGIHGVRGKNGQFRICVNGTYFTAPYNVDIVSCKFEDANSDGIIEPEESVMATLTVKNNGGMPLPPNRAVQFSLDNDHGKTAEVTHILSPFSAALTPGLGVNGITTLQQKLGFKVGKNIKQGHIIFKAVLDGVNKVFKASANFRASFDINYPVQLLRFETTPSILYTMEGLFSICLKNISTKDLGQQSLQNRVIRLTIHVDETKEGPKAKDIDFMDRQQRLMSGQPFVLDVPLLKSGEMQFISGTFQLNNNQFSPYDRVHLIASLHLTSQSDLNQISCIRTITSEVQCLQQPYQRDPNADFLLVVNSDFKRDEFDTWDVFTKFLCLSMRTWNVDLYKGISLFHPLNNNNDTLASDFRGKTIVFLNRKRISDHLPNFEMLRAARDYGIKFYVIGENISEWKQLVPSRQEVDKIGAKYLQGISSNHQNNAEVLHKKLIQDTQEYLKKDPRFSYILVELFPERIVEGHYKEMLVPRREEIYFLSPGPTQNEKNQSWSDFYTSKENVFPLLKMFPFEKKLNLLCRAYNYSEVIGEAILSDLADEQYLFALEKWTGEWTKENLQKNGLVLLNQFLTYNWSESIEDEVSNNLILNLILRFRALIKKMPKSDFIRFCGRKRTLSDYAKERIDQFLLNVFKLDKKGWNDRYLKQKEELKDMDFHTLWKTLRKFKSSSPEWPQLAIIKSSDLINEKQPAKAPEIGLPVIESAEQRTIAIQNLESKIYNELNQKEVKRND